MTTQVKHNSFQRNPKGGYVICTMSILKHYLSDLVWETLRTKRKKIELNCRILCENMMFMLRWSSSTDISLKKPINAKLKNLLSTVINSNREFVYRFIINLLISQFGKVRTLFCFWLARFWKNPTEILPFTMSLWRKDDITCQENYIKLIALQFSASQPNFILIC